MKFMRKSDDFVAGLNQGAGVPVPLVQGCFVLFSLALAHPTVERDLTDEPEYEHGQPKLVEATDIAI